MVVRQHRKRLLVADGLTAVVAVTLVLGLAPAARSHDADSFRDFSQRLVDVADQSERRAMTIAYLEEVRAYRSSLDEPADNVNDDLWLFDIVANALGDGVPDSLLLAVFTENRCLFTARRQLDYSAFAKRFMTADEFVDVCDLESLTQTVWVKSRQPLPVFSAPQLGAKVIGHVPGYASMRRLDEAGDYFRIRYGDVDGYVYAPDVAQF